MLKDLLREHAKLSAEIHALEQRIENERTGALATLPASFGYADLPSFLRAVRAACRAKKAPRTRKPRSVSKPAATVEVTASIAPTAPAVVAEQPLPVGTSLDDPANFGPLPDASVLVQGDLSVTAFQDRLAQALRFTERVLHTSKVPARVWREWRAFERRLSDALRLLRDSQLPKTSQDEP